MKKLKRTVEEITASLCEAVMSIEQSDIERREKTRQFKRLASSILKELGTDKRLSDERKLAATTRNKYLTQIRQGLDTLNLRHHKFIQSIERCSKKHPSIKEELYNIKDAKDNSTARIIKSNLLRSCYDNNEMYKDVHDIPIDHQILISLKLDISERALLKESYASELIERKNSTERIKFYAFIEKMDDILSSKHEAAIRGLPGQYARPYSDLLVGVAMATGRRFIEIVETGEFKKAEPGLIEFSGHAKKRRGEEKIHSLIYCLANPDLVLKAVEDIRKHPSIVKTKKRIKGASTDITYNDNLNKALASTVNDAAKRIFDDDTRVFKDTRAIWARIVFSKYFDKDPRWETVDEDVFWQHMLGHEDTETQQVYKAFKLDYGKDTGPLTRLEALKRHTGSNRYIQSVLETVIAFMEQNPKMGLTHEDLKKITTSKDSTIEKFLEETREALELPIYPPKAKPKATPIAEGLFRVTITTEGISRLDGEYSANTPQEAVAAAWSDFTARHPAYNPDR